MSFASFGDKKIDFQMSAIDLNELSSRLCEIKEAIERIEPIKVEVAPKVDIPLPPPAEKVDLSKIEQLMHELVSKQVDVKAHFNVEAPNVSHQTYIDYGLIRAAYGLIFVNVIHLSLQMYVILREFL